MKNLPHEIILLLYSHCSDLDTNTTINKLIDDSNIGRTEEIKAQKLRNILDAFETKGYLKWQASKQQPPFDRPMPHESYKTNFAKGEETLLNNSISAHLTPTGLDYAIDIDRQQVQHRNNNLAVWFAGATVVIAIFTMFMELNSHKRIEKEVQQLREPLQSSKKRLQTVASSVNYLIQARKNDSTKNVSKISKHD